MDRDEHALERLLTGRRHAGKLIGFRGDVADEASVASVVAAAVSVLGGISIFFNNAGIEGAVHPITEYPLAEFRRVLDVNVIGVFLGLKHVIPVMLAGAGGAIINTSSTAGLTGTPGVSAYNASKHTVIGLTRSAAAEWAARGIRINAVSPGPIDSRMMASLEDGGRRTRRVPRLRGRPLHYRQHYDRRRRPDRTLTGAFMRHPFPGP